MTISAPPRARHGVTVPAVRLAVCTLALLAMAGCASGGSNTAARKGQDAGAVTDALQVVQRLKVAGLPLTVSVTYNETTDPNHLLGRPTGYASKTAFVDTRVPTQSIPDVGGVPPGGSVEFFPTAEGAKSRGTYLMALQSKSAIFGVEYDYLNGPALLRVSGRLTPTQARSYRAALAQLKVQ